MLPALALLLLLAAAEASVLPEQIRIALTAGPAADTSMTVVFATSNLTEPGYTPIVQYVCACRVSVGGSCRVQGIGSTSLTAGCVTYNYTHEPTYQLSVKTHVCALSDLVPGTLYTYRVGSLSDGFSEDLSFTSAPPAGTEGVKMILYVCLCVYCVPR